MKSPKKEYNKRLLKFKIEFSKLKKINKLVSYSRAIVFIGILFLLIFFKSIHISVLIPGLTALLAGFIFLIKQNISIKRKIRQTEIKIKINENELTSLAGRFDIYHPGKEYIDTDHQYAYDLDIFGEGSIYQYLNRTCTISGKNQLANYLTHADLNKKSIVNKQNSIIELKDKLDWRQEFTSSALLNDKNFNENINDIKDDTLNRIQEWSNFELPFINKKIWKILLYLIPIITVAVLLISILKIIPFSFFILFGLINLTIIGIFLKRINVEHSKLSKTTAYLKTTQALLYLVENEIFSSQKLKTLANQLKSKKSAFLQIKKLTKTLQSFDSRLNVVASVMLNGILLWDLQILFSLEKQKKDLRNNVPVWFKILGKFDALACLANYSFNNPNYIFPEISDKEFYFEMYKGSHILLPKEKNVSNDFIVDGLKKISIITGANMAGKSTFLRTIGSNMILGAAGAPVSAEKLVFSPTEIFTSVRTSDSLYKNESYFYAELMRLKRITDSLKNNKKLFVILDEILKGTNSTDKHKGSYALIEQLIKYKASGLAATHDVQLGKLEEKYPDNISNKRFEVDIVDNEAVFDYKLKNGISQSLNATFLMKKYGIIE